MPENRFQSQRRGRNIDDSVAIFLDGVAFSGWKAVKISKNLESIANSFSLEIDERFTETGKKWPIIPGPEIEIRIGKEGVLTGHIETLDTSFGKDGRNYSVGGRSKPGDLVECTVEGACEFNNINLAALAEKLIAPFGLKVFLSVEPTVIDKFAVKPGETVFEALNRAAKLQGFFWVSTRAGNIRLTKRAKFRAATELHQNFNVTSGSLRIDTTKRHSTYTVKGQSAGTDEYFGKNASEAEGSAIDLAVKRHRPLTIIAEGSVDTAQAQIRAGWEASVRKAEGNQITGQIDGWTQEDGSLWGINQLVQYKSSLLGINLELLITQVDHSKGANAGTITELTLAPADAYESKPEFPADDDILSVLGPS